MSAIPAVPIGTVRVRPGAAGPLAPGIFGSARVNRGGRSRMAGLLRNPTAMVGLALLAVMAAGALGAPWLGAYDPVAQDLDRRLEGPSASHLLGTDSLGRDTLSRLLWGARVSLGTAGIVMLLVLTTAVLVGTVSGYFGGWVDQVLMRLVDLLMAFPGIVLAIAVAGVLGPGLRNVVIAIAAVSWVDYARVIRAMTLSLREREYVLAARTLGAVERRIITRHVIPNLVGPLLVLATLDLARVILTISALNFLGLGVQPPTPEWGAMLNDGLPFLQIAPVQMIYPGLAICLTALGVNLLGDGLRDVLDPQGSAAAN